LTTAVSDQLQPAAAGLGRLGTAAGALPAPVARRSLALQPGFLGPLAPLVQQFRDKPRLPLIVGAALLATIVAGAVLFGRSPDYKILYANVSDRDGGAIVASLQQMNVPYKFTEGSGSILVPADKAAEARLKLAAQGLPKAGGVGFELLDNQRFGTSQFAEQINYQRGLEGELARSIESIGSVQSARVHLALPKQSLFVRDQKKPSASIVLALHPGRSVDEGQVSAIVHLVSSSVTDMDAKSVTVVDQRGNLLSAANSAARGLDGSQLKYVDSVEQSYVHRIENILQPITGAGNVRAQVAADVDFSVVEATDEKYTPNADPAKSAIRSQQSSESSQDGASGAGGVPGALSNQPPLNATAPLNASSAAVATARAGRGSNRKDSTVNYEVDRSIRHTQQSAGAVKRLSVAVVVNNREVVKNGAKSMVPLSAAEVEQVRNLVKQAMGFNETRGDSVNVVNTSFNVDNYVAPQLPVWRDPANIELARMAGPYLVILVAALVVGLAMRRRKRSAVPMELEALAQGAEAHGVHGAAANALPGRAAQAALPEPAEDPIKLQELARRKASLDYAQLKATEEPQLVSALVRHWMNER
jgi:flagellar M-ring protein FliF